MEERIAQLEEITGKKHQIITYKICPFCKEKFDGHDELQRHINGNCPKSGFKHEDDTDKKNKKKKKEWKCEHCEEVFRLKRELDRHRCPEIEKYLKYIPRGQKVKRERPPSLTMEERIAKLEEITGEKHQIITYKICPLCRGKFENLYSFNVHLRDQNCPGVTPTPGGR